MLWKNAIVPSALEFVRRPDTEKTILACPQDRYKQYTDLAYLSTYMGHVSLEETLYYIHLLPERLKSSPGIDWKMLNDIYQTEEGSDEED